MKKHTKVSKVLILVVATIFMMSCDQKSQSSDKATSVKSKRPNILLIVADDMGYTDIGSFGSEISTPTLDGLAEEGLQLTNFHVLPTCSPRSLSVLTPSVGNYIPPI